MLKLVVLVVVVLLTIVLVYVATRPDTLHVERAIDIKASPEKIFGLINDFRQWNDWTPYNKDPAMKKTYSGSASGKGAMYAWEGNKEVGQGEISITGSTPSSEVALELHMIKPFEGRNSVVFSLSRAGDSTRVTWSLDGKQNFISRLMGLIFNMDKMIGGDFEVGLARLKTVAER
ncbi:MAG: SRPBCC family protein [Nitrosomonadales bacterium]|nr:SRPBCC family protein [Nitrosomonadales bacterium]